MNKRVPAVRVLVVSVLTAYVLLGILSTGGAVLPTSVLVLVLVLWFSVYKLRHKGIGNRGLVTKMRADFAGVLEGTKERVAQQEARRRATVEHEEQARLEQERRRAERESRRESRPTRDPAVSTYADLIESRVREGEQQRRRGSEER
jgi:ABC-type transport system involved in cytochrome bd biosynthesis fused ATPase/permease subunit